MASFDIVVAVPNALVVSRCPKFNNFLTISSGPLPTEIAMRIAAFSLAEPHLESVIATRLFITVTRSNLSLCRSARSLPDY